MPTNTPTIVFVHGAWADATGFDGSIRALRERGFAVVGAANPLRHLTGDTASLAALLGTISGPIVLVGHSYGGAVMSNAATGNEQVQALVFIAGWMPDEGESIQQLLEAQAFADSLVPAALRPVPFKNPDGSDVRRRRRPRHRSGDGGDPATLERRRGGHPLRPAGVAIHPRVVPAGHRGSSHPAGGATIHGRAWKRADPGGGSLPRVHGLAAGDRDTADPQRRRGDKPQPAMKDHHR
jgi:pimeloyl-ACP methyl ester carboxylesterase